MTKHGLERLNQLISVLFPARSRIQMWSIVREKMKRIKVILFVLFLITSELPAAQEKFSGICQTGSNMELEENIKAHSEHIFRLNEKFLNIWYRQEPLPSDYKPPELKDIQNYLKKLKTRKAAVLFYAHCDSRGQLCAWLILSDHIVMHKARLSKEKLLSINLEIMDALGVTGLARKRAPEPKRGVQRLDSEPPKSRISAKEALEETSKLLFPRPIASILLDKRIDTLIIMPISEIGTLPFGAFQVADKSLVDVMSFVIAPGFFDFVEEPRRTRHVFVNPLIVGDPQYPEDNDWNLPQLPGARNEAMEVARFLQKSALIGPQATKKALYDKLKARPDTGLIYLATHGIADSDNPLDASVLWMSDGRWPARDIQNLPIREAAPLVVMSACQTGLGKSFDVGTIGMARAWNRAGASSVVMSLWNVDDAATKLLMIDFIRLATELPPDKALQEAMRRIRKKITNPALWASFSIFGLPEISDSISKEKQ